MTPYRSPSYPAVSSCSLQPFYIPKFCFSDPLSAPEIFFLSKLTISENLTILNIFQVFLKNILPYFALHIPPQLLP